ncbi:serine/threonine protein phosphatase, putative [Cryptosporidium muris RN66]|uniref:Serine/threonine protein phosphatase, putative n=1 Tax=Cryptosporidium muris (strain RN66) TaxID=441375 RepID=B6AK32_CRYMR|nr:serine/threonine protein phosphatase, putative [Cryptosporidium muris RN66]EEA08573.1 serine/threonine protein phosphatase, putative [Cryptosporidium muris RN66]|eukprot:XP_002142922.1 serine/threonine protein phosphatase [Cryptosporidium muris RN66]
MKIAVQGCCHGELNRLYESIERMQNDTGNKVDLIICCGDFHTIRNNDDLQNMAIKSHKAHLGDFSDYYNGNKIAPILTVFVGGNHEVPDVLIPLYFGGWVAPNIFYLGYTGVIKIGGIRIAGISGIYKDYDFYRGYYEEPPFSESSKRSWYHIRWYEMQKLMLLDNSEGSCVDIMISHDWPNGIERFGNLRYLLKRKPFFKDDIENGNFGIRGCMDIMMHLKPKYWFSGHHHCYFEASIPIKESISSSSKQNTIEFRAIDKFKPFGCSIRYFNIFCNNKINDNETKELKIEFDIEWLSIQRCSLKNYPKGNFKILNNEVLNLQKPSIDDRIFIDEYLKKLNQQDISENNEDIDELSEESIQWNFKTSTNINNLIYKDRKYIQWPHWDSTKGNYKDYKAQRNFILDIIGHKDIL